MIRTENLSKSFGNRVAVDEVSINVKNQEIYGLVGPDGAGKTTLMRMICGLIEPDRGEIWLMGRPAREVGKNRHWLGYMPQRFSLYGDLKVMENIYFFGAMYNLPRRVIEERAEEILAMTGLSPFKERFADNLSGGMKQKLALTCCLITRPSILILDEPTYGVDPEYRKEFWRTLYDLNQNGMTIMVSTPYMDEAELCHRVALISQGRIRAVATPQQLKQDFPYPLLEVRTSARDPRLFAGIEGVLEVSFYGDKYHVAVEDSERCEAVLRQTLERQGVRVDSIRPVPPTMEDVFVFMAERGEGMWNMLYRSGS